MTQLKFAPIIELITRFSIASQLYQSQMERQLIAHDLTLPQLSVLSHLSRRVDPQRITSIAAAVEVGQPAVTKMLAKFENRGWITFHASTTDKRSKSARITEMGKTHQTNTQRQLLPNVIAELVGWSETDLAQFSENLNRFGKLLDSNR